MLNLKLQIFHLNLHFLHSVVNYQLFFFNKKIFGNRSQNVKKKNLNGEFAGF